ncbi:unnamed protein product [Lymnaea stagnalis]|uniref:Chitin-binding type-2 domain-containing protein n=1 Tax=Lymnaea stagnalis TaxID=6523 RepID=A0AAV2IH51_LYMST
MKLQTLSVLIVLILQEWCKPANSQEESAHHYETTSILPTSPTSSVCESMKDGRQPDPTSCSKYYICVNYVAIPRMCRQFHNYDPAIKYCRLENEFECEIVKGVIRGAFTHVRQKNPNARKKWLTQNRITKEIIKSPPKISNTKTTRKSIPTAHNTKTIRKSTPTTRHTKTIRKSTPTTHYTKTIRRSTPTTGYTKTTRKSTPTTGYTKTTRKSTQTTGYTKTTRKSTQTTDNTKTTTSQLQQPAILRQPNSQLQQPAILRQPESPLK